MLITSFVTKTVATDLEITKLVSHNIQSLFSIIQPEQVRQYLKGKTWRCETVGDLLVFELPATEDSEARQLSLPADSKHPRLRRLMPNVIFSLAVIYKREAIEIAREIAEIQLEPTSAAAAAPAPSSSLSEAASAPSPAKPSEPVTTWKLELINAHQASVVIRSRFDQEPFELQSGQTLQVRGQAGTTCQVYLTSDCELDFSGSVAPKLIPGLPCELSVWRRNGWDIATGLCDYVRTLVAQDFDRSETGWVDAMVADFTFVLGEEPAAVDVALRRRLCARFLKAISQRYSLQQRSWAPDSVLALARVLMGIGNQILIADSSSAESLSRLLGWDSPDSPRKVVDWLSMHSRTL